MTTRRWGVAGGLLLGLWLTAHTTAPLRGQDGESPSAATPSSDSAQQQMRIRYAEAYLKLMEATLANYEDTNRRNPNTIRPAVMELVQEDVAKARERLQAAQSGETNDSRMYVLRAEAELRLAEEGLRRAMAANQQRPNTVRPPEVARLNAQRDLARVKVEKARLLAAESPLANVRYEIDELREDVQELRLMIMLVRFGR